METGGGQSPGAPSFGRRVWAQAYSRRLAARKASEPAIASRTCPPARQPSVARQRPDGPAAFQPPAEPTPVGWRARCVSLELFGCLSH